MEVGRCRFDVLIARKGLLSLKFTVFVFCQPFFFPYQELKLLKYE